MADGVRVEFNVAALARIAGSVELRSSLLAGARPVVEAARGAAPRRTGRGAASIRAKSVLEDGVWTVRVGWSRDAYYMRFHELGSRYLPARPFLKPALNRYANP